MAHTYFIHQNYIHTHTNTILCIFVISGVAHWFLFSHVARAPRWTTKPLSLYRTHKNTYIIVYRDDIRSAVDGSPSSSVVSSSTFYTWQVFWLCDSPITRCGYYWWCDMRRWKTTKVAAEEFTATLRSAIFIPKHDDDDMLRLHFVLHSKHAFE